MPAKIASSYGGTPSLLITKLFTKGKTYVFLSEYDENDSFIMLYYE
jgi:hypothetical protein